MNILKKILIAVLIGLMTQMTIQAQTISTVLRTVPDNVLIGLEATDIDAFLVEGADSTIVVESSFYPAIKRNALSADFISLQTSDSAFTQIKLLPLVNDSKIICVIKRVCAKACDSQISFYTLAWKPIPKHELFPKIDLNYFFKKEINRESQDFNNATTPLDINFVKLEFSAKDNNISARFDVKNYLSEDDYKAIEPFLTKSAKVLYWDKISFKIVD